MSRSHIKVGWLGQKWPLEVIYNGPVCRHLAELKGIHTEACRTCLALTLQNVVEKNAVNTKAVMTPPYSSLYA